MSEQTAPEAPAEVPGITVINGIPIPDGALIADGFDSAILGAICLQGTTQVVYSYDKCVKTLVEDQEMSVGEAVEWMDFNVVDAYMGPNTPVFLDDRQEYLLNQALGND